jgi:WD40 repeat protein
MASSCRATQPEHAQVLLWDLASGLQVWRSCRFVRGDNDHVVPASRHDLNCMTSVVQVASLPGHKLSVVQLAFSPDDAWLISASRDRQWSLFKRVDAADSAAPYVHLLTMPKAHARIIWYAIERFRHSARIV